MQKDYNLEESLEFIQDAVVQRKLPRIEELNKKIIDTPKDLERIKDNKLIKEVTNNKTNLKTDSPYSKEFNNIINDWQYLKPSSNSNDNPFYAPALFDIIYERLYLLPLWTGIPSDHIRRNYSLVKSIHDNNPVENYFGIKKSKRYAKSKNVNKRIYKHATNAFVK